jgi:hypothetical protein
LKVLETKKAKPPVPQLFQFMERLLSTNTDPESRNAAQLVNTDPLQMRSESDAATGPPMDAQHWLPRCLSHELAKTLPLSFPIHGTEVKELEFRSGNYVKNKKVICGEIINIKCSETIYLNEVLPF